MSNGTGIIVKHEDIYYTMIGLCVGDALGVPVEFTSRANLDKHPIDDMVGYGVFDKPPGTWSDDTSMMLALADSLAGGKIDYDDIMSKFTKWLYKGAYTTDGNTFDVGRTTERAIRKYSKKGTSPLECGGTDINDNGNGSLMRILPATFFLASKYEDIFEKEVIEIIHNLSALTHAHIISKIACVAYCNIALTILTIRHELREDKMWQNNKDRKWLLYTAVAAGTEQGLGYYRDDYCGAELDEFWDLVPRLNGYLPFYKREEIKSSGYVVDTFKAAVWCLLENDDYASTVLAAVNLGGDTDTTAAVAGGLAGLFYQDDENVGIPKRWIEGIENVDLVETICNKLSQSLCYVQMD